MYLQQNDMTVAEYEREFIRLSWYAKELVSIEADKCARFERGLNNEIRVHLAALDIREFSALVERALKVEQVKEEEQKRKNWSQIKEVGDRLVLHHF